MKKYIANTITSLRILLSIIMFHFPVFSVKLYILYLFCGFSDMIDGTIARKTKASGEFGARFDTAADFIFLAVSIIKFLPLIHIPKWLWIWVIIILIIKVSVVIWGVVFKKKLISLHTIMNKATGFLLFLLPLTLNFIDLKYSSVAVCLVATFSTIQEGYYVITSKNI